MDIQNARELRMALGRATIGATPLRAAICGTVVRRKWAWADMGETSGFRIGFAQAPAELNRAKARMPTGL